MRRVAPTLWTYARSGFPIYSLGVSKMPVRADQLENGRACKADPICARNFMLRDVLSAANDSSATRRQWICVVWLLGLISTAAWAISPTDSPVMPSYVRTDFTVDDGLPDNVVSAITQTQNGLLWMASGNQLASFDGRIFTPFQLRI